MIIYNIIYYNYYDDVSPGFRVKRENQLFALFIGKKNSQRKKTVKTGLRETLISFLKLTWNRNYCIY